MLPFLKKAKLQTGVIVKERSPDEKPEENQEDSGLEDCAKELISAIEMKDPKAVARVIKDMFQITDSEPHSEGEHIEPHSYEASKS